MSTQFYRVGGLVTDTYSDIIFLYGNLQTTGRVSTLRKANPGTAGYAITAGKTFYITKIIVSGADTSGSATMDSVSLGYADNDVGYDSAAARTNPVNILGQPEEVTAALAGGILWDDRQTGTNGKLLVWNNVVIPAAPAGKYMYFKGFMATAPMNVQIWGVEK